LSASLPPPPPTSTLFPYTTLFRSVCREKKLTNIRAASADKSIILKPPRQMTLEQALEYIEEDELVEVTPGAIRMRKTLLKETERSEEHTSELQSLAYLVCRLLLEK